MKENRGAAVNNSCSERVRAFYSTKKEALSGLIKVNDDEEKNGGQAGRMNKAWMDECAAR